MPKITEVHDHVENEPFKDITARRASQAAGATDKGLAEKAMHESQADFGMGVDIDCDCSGDCSH